MSQDSIGAGTTLVLGGARSGKSAFAEKRVLESGLRPIYIATAQIWDDEMRLRANAHIARRGEAWNCIEEPNDLEGVLREADQSGNHILVDCLTLWLTNLMMAEVDIPARISSLIAQISAMNTPLVLVTNEVGLGIVPDNKMAREFRDHAGILHQKIAEISEEVYFIAAGLPLQMKG
jgi:adenosylcobinamide kinase/adenosylcobinamide-phosphate guanylyltransferase